jgi:hypothetical protein
MMSLDFTAIFDRFSAAIAPLSKGMIAGHVEVEPWRV